MAGSASVPNTFTAAVGNQGAALLDADFTSLVNYINNREVTKGLLANRPAAGTAGNWYFASDASGGTLYVDDGVAWNQVAAAVAAFVYTDQLSGLALSNDGASPNTVLDIAAGAAASNDAAMANRIIMVLTAAATKTTGAWVVGSGNGGMASGAAVAANTWYHVFVIKRTDTGVVDIAFDTSATGANIAANTNAAYTKVRRIGSFKTATASTNILAFTQDGDFFQWAATVLDVNANNPGVAAVTRTLTTPLGVNTIAKVTVAIQNANGATICIAYVSDLAVNDEAPSISAAPLGHAAAGPGSGYNDTAEVLVRTNTSSQIRSRISLSDANVTVNIATLGWFDRRGRG